MSWRGNQSRFRDISAQLAVWQERTGYDDEKAALELGVPPEAFKRWKAGGLCGLAAMIETKIGVPVAAKGKLVGAS